MQVTMKPALAALRLRRIHGPVMSTPTRKKTRIIRRSLAMAMPLRSVPS